MQVEIRAIKEIEKKNVRDKLAHQAAINFIADPFKIFFSPLVDKCISFSGLELCKVNRNSKLQFCS